MVLGRVGGPEATDGAGGWLVNGSVLSSTGVVTVIVVYTKFRKGAWIVIIAVPVIVVGFKAIHRHYASVNEALSAGTRPKMSCRRTDRAVRRGA